MTGSCGERLHEVRMFRTSASLILRSLALSRFVDCSLLLSLSVARSLALRTPVCSRLVVCALLACGSVAGCDDEGGDPMLVPGAPHAIGAIAYAPGAGGGFGAEALPDVVLGAPRGSGLRMGSTDVLSLGSGGSITLELGAAAIDGEGADFLVFENPFRIGGSPTNVYVEPALVEVSVDGTAWNAFPCDPALSPFAGCAGLSPVLANIDTNMLDSRDPLIAGGDAFDLATIGVSRARFVRITDGGRGRVDGAGTDGFDLDAISVIHAEGE